MLGRPLFPFFLQPRIILSLETGPFDEKQGQEERYTAAWDHEVVYISNSVCCGAVSR